MSGHTYTQLLYHLVFSTKLRAALITPELESRLYDYLGGILRGEKGALLEIGGMSDHVHLLARVPPTIEISKMLQLLKGNSSSWINNEVWRLRKRSRPKNWCW